MEKNHNTYHSFYIRRDIGIDNNIDLSDFLTRNHFKNFLLANTNCGWLLTLKNDLDAKRFATLKLPFNSITKLQKNKAADYQQAVFLQQVPTTIPLEDLKQALILNGITKANIERKRQHVQIKIYEPEHYNSLLQNGLDFFGATRFAAIPDRGMKSSINWHDRRSNLSTNGKFILQCYHCQGFWHMAEDCKNSVRCIRCGEGHNVEICVRPRSDPLCCNCGGPHHAAYKFCPVRLDFINAVPITMTLSTNENGQPPRRLL